MSATPRATGPAAGPRTTVGVAGAGRVGAVLGAGLREAGLPVVAASGRSAASAHRIARLLPGTPRVPVADVVRAADLVLFAVPDDALGPLVAHLAESGLFRPGQVVLHTSGAHGTGILHPAVARGAVPLAVHPAMTFTGHATDRDRLRAGVSFGVTAPEAARDLAESLVRAWHGRCEWIAPQHRALYHAGLAHGANHLVTLVNEALDQLRDAGVHHPEQVLSPLLHAALDNALAHGDAALTGPVSRGDAGTVAGHLAALAARSPESVPAYRELARRTADRAIAAGRLTPAAAAPLLDVLARRSPVGQRASTR